MANVSGNHHELGQHLLKIQKFSATVLNDKLLFAEATTNEETGKKVKQLCVAAVIGDRIWGASLGMKHPSGPRANRAFTAIDTFIKQGGNISKLLKKHTPRLKASLSSIKIRKRALVHTNIGEALAPPKPNMLLLALKKSKNIPKQISIEAYCRACLLNMNKRDIQKIAKDATPLVKCFFVFLRLCFDNGIEDPKQIVAMIKKTKQANNCPLQLGRQSVLDALKLMGKIGVPYDAEMNEDGTLHNIYVTLR